MKINDKFKGEVAEIINPHLLPERNIDNLIKELSFMDLNIRSNYENFEFLKDTWKDEKKLWKSLEKKLSKNLDQIEAYYSQYCINDNSDHFLQNKTIQKLKDIINDDINSIYDCCFYDVGKTGQKMDMAFYVFVSSLCRKWFEYTGKKPSKTSDFETPFKNFVYAAYENIENQSLFKRELSDDSIKDIIVQTEKIKNFYATKIKCE